MATSWRSWYVKCPFYLRDSKCKITCQGVADGNEIIMKFSAAQDFEIQMGTFCCDKYRNCEVYRMLRQLYEED